MVRWFLRLCKRLLVLGFGAGIIWLSISQIFPYFERRTPILIALGLTYCLVAYLLLPTCVRVFKFFFRTSHIPIHTVTPDGFACDPVNIALVGSLTSIKKAFEDAGWHEADPHTFRNILRIVIAVILGRPYKNAPFSPLYLFGRSQDVGFQKSIGTSPRQRHHIRFWQVIPQPEGKFRDHIKYWLAHYGEITPGRTLWVGAATEDIGIGVVLHNAQVTHNVHPDTNEERDFVVRELKKAGVVIKSRTINASKPYRLRNRSSGTSLIADGSIKLLELK